jgi:thiamine phosphate synthase YjbQ (UPF0047 family)
MRSHLLSVCLQDALDKLAPEGNHYRHVDEGYDDMPAHVKVRVYWLDSSGFGIGSSSTLG